MSHEIILKNSEVRDPYGDHRRKRTITILGNDNIASPGGRLPKISPLDLAYGFVDWKRHPVTRDGRVENNIWVGEVPIHTIQCL